MIHALHGHAGQPADLTPLLEAVGAEHRAWHLWEFLRAQPRAASLTSFAEQFQKAICQSARPGPRVLLGYSLGARLALHVLLHEPEKWDAAILIAPHPGLTFAAERQQRLTHDLTWRDRFLTAADWSAVLAEWNAQPLLAAGAAPADTVSSRWQRDIAIASDAWSLGRQQDLRPSLSGIPCPVLWITGEQDEKFTALAATACPLLPRGEHHIIPGARHRAHLDQPSMVAQVVAGFLQ